LIKIDLPSKTMTLLVNGRQRTVGIRDEVDQLVDQLGLSVVNNAVSNDVFAPMPGLVLDIMVAAGDEIEEGTPLLILEAMKMENVLKAEGSGKIARIAVEKGVAVDKRQLLIEIE
jgi:biotin carboxyl carrier protein